MARTGIRTLPTTKLPVPKAAAVPKMIKPAAIVPPPILTPQQSLKQFVTKPVVKPPRPVVKPLKVPMKTYLP